MSEFVFGLYVFVLAGLVGYHVIWGVTPALHTPLMAVTNAISAVVVVGALIVAGQSLGNWVDYAGFFAVMLAAINIVGGFVVTYRMLAMFRKRED